MSRMKACLEAYGCALDVEYATELEDGPLARDWGEGATPRCLIGSGSV